MTINNYYIFRFCFVNRRNRRLTQNTTSELYTRIRVKLSELGARTGFVTPSVACRGTRLKDNQDWSQLCGALNSIQALWTMFRPVLEECHIPADMDTLPLSHTFAWLCSRGPLTVPDLVFVILLLTRFFNLNTSFVRWHQLRLVPQFGRTASAAKNLCPKTMLRPFSRSKNMWSQKKSFSPPLGRTYY